MDVFQTFADIPAAGSATAFFAVPLSERRRDFVAKAMDGSPVFLLHDAGPISYSPSIELKNVSAQFHVTCQVTTEKGAIEDQFAVVSCGAAVPELYELFVRCFSAAVEQLPVVAMTNSPRGCVQELLDLFRTLSFPNNREVIGLWAELYVISVCKDIAQALRAWHADGYERFDFSSTKGCLEVKATVKEQRTHEFALEQLRSPHNGRGRVASLLLQPMTGGVGVMDLARSIESAAVGEPLLRQKLWKNVADALGSDFSDRLDRRFDPYYAERHLIVLAMGDIPAPVAPSDPRVTEIRFRADLASVESSASDSPSDILGHLFAY